MASPPLVPSHAPTIPAPAASSGIVRAYSFRIGPAVTAAAVEKVLAGLPIGDGISLHRVRGVFEDGHLVQVELHIGPPVTPERIQLGRMRVEQGLAYGFVTSPQRTGLDGDDPDDLFQRELGKIQPPKAATLAGTLERLLGVVQGAGLIFAGIAVLAVVFALRR